MSISKYLHFGRDHISETAVAFERLLGPWANFIDLLNALVLAISFCAIQWKFRGAWTVIWILFALSLLEFLIPSFIMARDLPEGNIALFGLAVAGGAAAVYWGFWLVKQKDYFS